jgi:calcineurin-like phosphoesterase family protein
MNLVGVVADGATPIVGAVVSDGYTVTTTDADGIYQLRVNEKTKFVFVSVPSDCEVPMTDGIPKIYQSLADRKTGEVVRKDFALKRKTPVAKFTLLVLADVQIGDAEELNWLKRDEMPKIAAYVQQELIKPDVPVYGLSLGDLVWDNMPYFKDYATEIKRLAIPVFQIIGNHDHDRTVLNDDYTAARHFETNFGPTYYSYNIGNCHFVVLDDVNYSAVDDYAAHITENQLNWLKEDLKYVSKDKLIIMGVHIPTSRRNRPALDVSNKQDLYTILNGYKVRILSGHLHNNQTSTISNTIEENNLGAVMGAFWNNPCNDGSPRGFAVYEIDGNQITNWYYKGTDTDRNYQMKLYGLGQAVTPSRQDGIILNLFAWHTNWTVELYEDNEYKTSFTESLRNPFEKDRTAYDYLYGSNKPTHRPSAEPEEYNDHMFYYKPSSPTWEIIKVIATDPYGNTYEERINR